MITRAVRYDRLIVCSLFDEHAVFRCHWPWLTLFEVDFLKNPAVIGGIAAVFVLLVVTTATIVVRKRRAKPARRSSFRRKYSAGYKAPVERKAAPEDDTTMEDSSSGQFGGPELSESQTSYSEPGENTVDIYNSTSAAKLPNSYPYPEH